MLEDLEKLKQEAMQRLAAISQSGDLEEWRVVYLGRKSLLTQRLRALATLPPDERKTVGAYGNRLKKELEQGHQKKQQELRDAQLAQARTGAIDITLPGKSFPVGYQHPMTRTLNEVCDIFIAMGFKVFEGPDVEWDYYNFEALNIPKEHPARDGMSTFWIDAETVGGQDQMLLRTHTTAVSARVVEIMDPPIRVVEPGKVYRYEATDATHLPMFINFDGLAVDYGITMADLKGTLYEFSRRFFGEDRKVRFRCDYFPFVEPGVEMAIECSVCGGKGCRLCGYTGWIEILGAGMTHPDVLRRGGIDPEVYTSFAFGIGVERLHMLRHGIDDMRLYYGSDLRFLRQFL